MLYSKIRKETQMKFYKVITISTMLYGTKNYVQAKKDLISGLLQSIIKGYIKNYKFLLSITRSANVETTGYACRKNYG